MRDHVDHLMEDPSIEMAGYQRDVLAPVANRLGISIEEADDIADALGLEDYATYGRRNRVRRYDRRYGHVDIW